MLRFNHGFGLICILIAICAATCQPRTAAAQFAELPVISEPQYADLINMMGLGDQPELNSSQLQAIRDWYNTQLNALTASRRAVLNWSEALQAPGHLPGWNHVMPDPLGWNALGVLASATLELVDELDAELSARLGAFSADTFSDLAIREFLAIRRHTLACKHVRAQSGDNRDNNCRPVHLAEILRLAYINPHQLHVHGLFSQYRHYLTSDSKAIRRLWDQFLENYHDDPPDTISERWRAARSRNDEPALLAMADERAHLGHENSKLIEQIALATWHTGIAIAAQLPGDDGVRLRFVLREQIISPLMDENWTKMIELCNNDTSGEAHGEVVQAIDARLQVWERTSLDDLAAASGWRLRELTSLDEILEWLEQPADRVSTALAAKQRARRALNLIATDGLAMLEGGS